MTDMNTPDTELFEQAAKALGRECRWFGAELRLQRPDRLWELWSPLADDGDGARLEAALRIEIVWYETSARAQAFDERGMPASEGVFEPYANHSGDKQAARRRAAVRAAAALAA
jgi:hypothetical protein